MKDTTLRRALPPLLILLAILPATTSAVVAGRLGSTGGEAVHILGEPESGLYTESDLRRLPDPGAAVPAFLLELVGSDLVSLRRVQAACLALALLLLFLTTASVGLPPVAVLTFAALMAGQLFLAAAFSLALVRYGLASVFLAGAARLGLLSRAPVPLAVAGLCLAAAVLLVPPLLFLLPALALLLPRPPRLRRLIEIASPSEAAAVETNGERARSDRPSRTRRYGDRASEDVSRQTSGGCGRNGEVVSISLLSRVLAAICALPVLLVLLPKLNLPALEKMLFGTSEGSLVPFLGFEAGAVLRWLSEGPAAVGSGLLFLYSVMAVPARLVSGLLGREGGVVNPVLLLLAAVVLLHPVALLVAHRFSRVRLSALEILRFEVLCALLAGTAAWLFCFARAHSVVALAMFLPAPFLLSTVLLLGRLPGRHCRMAALVWAASCVVEVAVGLGPTLHPPPAMSLDVQREVVAAVAARIENPACHRHTGDETAAMFALLAPTVRVDQGRDCGLEIVTTELPASPDAACSDRGIPFPDSGPPGFCLYVTSTPARARERVAPRGTDPR